MNHYQILEINPNASLEVVKAAYRVLQLKYRGNKSRQQKLNVAKGILFDEDKRREYDEERRGKGKEIGGYRILESIAEGGFGTTYKAEHIATEKLVCLKHMNNVSAFDHAVLIQEARTCWDLRHWGIPAMRDILEMPDDSIALVMSYVPGPTLAEIFEKYSDGIDPEHVAWMTERILNTLKYLHYSGVIHGDLKPQNIIIQPEDHTAVLVDYGLSQVKPTRTDEALGYTPFFAAPEQTDGKPLIPQTDFYGLGMTMIFALGGDVARVKVPSHTPDPMVDFIKKLIKKHAISRPDWKEEDLCESIATMRKEAFGRNASNMKPLKLDW